MGRTGKIALELDFNTATASMELNEPRVFRVGPDFLLKRSVEDLLTVAQHEGGHADITRIGTGYFFQSEKLRSLLNVVEDLRVNARAMDRAPGRKEAYLRFLKDYYYESYKNLSTDKVPDLLPHEAFLQAVMSKVYGGESPWDGHEVVGPALNKALPHIEEAMRSRPTEANPEEPEVQAHFGKFEEVLKEKILPIYDSLYQESLKEVEKRLEQEAQAGTAGKEKAGSGQGAGRGTIDPRDLSEKARKLLEDRAKKIADAHGPQGTRGEQQAKARKIYGSGEEIGPEGKPDNTDARPENQNGGGSDRLEDFLDGRHQDYRRQQQELSGKEYSKALSELGRLPDQVFQVFDQLLKPNTDFEYEGHFTSGPKIDVARAIKAIEGLTTRLSVFKRKTEPTAKDYRFSLLLDASGSMADNGPRQRGGLGLATMFADVFERLELPYSLDAFHDSYVPIKGFEKRLRTSAERNGLFNQMVLDTWGGGGTNLRQGLAGSLKRILEEQRKDKRDREFLFVLTDGEETHLEGPEVRTLCEEAAKRGVIVVGIGIGEGMDSVRKNFPVYLTEKNPERLPQLMAEFIKEYVKGQVEDHNCGHAH
ncbi:MAG: VWA domain-containing protein [Deltaproteobacteria bacterium]|nr:VWA domain-containing protein [Deltaproteobacteria bacterium]